MSDSNLFGVIGRALAASRAHGEEPDAILLHREAHKILVKEMTGIEASTYLEWSALYGIPCAVDYYGDLVTVGQNFLFVKTMRRYLDE